MFIKKNSFEKILSILFILGIFFFSFNQIEMFPFMGEYLREFGAVFFFLGFFLLSIEILKSGKITIPYNNLLFQLIIFFYLIAIICSVLNFGNIINSYFKRTTGLSRLIRQFISLSIPIFVFLPFFWRVIKEWSPEKIFSLIRKTFLFTLLFASFYSIWEVLYSYFNFFPAKYVIDTFNILPFMKTSIHSGGRISSIAYEVPFFAIFLITISGWMFSYIITEKKILPKITPTILVLSLTFFSGSRTGLIVIFFIFILFLIYLYKNNLYRKQINISAIVLIICSLLIIGKNDKIKSSITEKIESLDFVSNLKSDTSNRTRFGMQYAALKVFNDHPIIGVGFGQQAYYTQYYYPRWATINNYEFEGNYKNKKVLSFPPGYNLYTRILCEMGIIGFISWLSIILYSFYLIRKLIKITKKPIIKTMLISIGISLLGLYINWFQIDTFRMYGVWINIIILIKLSELYKNKKNV